MRDLGIKAIQRNRRCITYCWASTRVRRGARSRGQRKILFRRALAAILCGVGPSGTTTGMHKAMDDSRRAAGLGFPDGPARCGTLREDPPTPCAAATAETGSSGGGAKGRVLLLAQHSHHDR